PPGRRRPRRPRPRAAFRGGTAVRCRRPRSRGCRWCWGPRGSRRHRSGTGRSPGSARRGGRRSAVIGGGRLRSRVLLVVYARRPVPPARGPGRNGDRRTATTVPETLVETVNTL